MSDILSDTPSLQLNTRGDKKVRQGNIKPFPCGVTKNIYRGQLPRMLLSHLIHVIWHYLVTNHTTIVTLCTYIRYSPNLFSSVVLYLIVSIYKSVQFISTTTINISPRPKGVLSRSTIGGRGCHKFVPILAGEGTKTAPQGDLLGQPPGEMS